MRGLPYAAEQPFSSVSWVSASRSQNLASVSHAHLSSPSLQVFALRRHSLTSMRLLLLLSDIGRLAYPRRAYRIVSPSWHSSSTRPAVTIVTAPRREHPYREYRGSRDHAQSDFADQPAIDARRYRSHRSSLYEHR